MGGAAVRVPEVLFGPRKGASLKDRPESTGLERERPRLLRAATALIGPGADAGAIGTGNKPSPSRLLVRPGHDGVCKCDGENASDGHGRFHPECHRGPRAGQDSVLSFHPAMGYYGL